MLTISLASRTSSHHDRSTTTLDLGPLTGPTERDGCSPACGVDVLTCTSICTRWWPKGDKVVCIGIMSGTHDGQFHGIPATHQPTAARHIHVLTFDDAGLITDHLAVRDDVTVLRQLGALPDAARREPTPHRASARAANDENPE